MVRSRVAVVLILALVMLAVLAEPALAGPGGMIAKAAAKSFWGKLVVAVLAVILLPFGIWVLVKEWRAERRATRALRALAEVDPRFHPARVRTRMHECFVRVHAAWTREQMAEASEVMTDWYWQNQQLLHITRWEAMGQVNRCHVKSVGRIRPLHVEAEVADGEVRSARIVASITANMQDYLADRKSGKVIEGDEKYKDVETVWTFVLSGGALKVEQIQEAHSSLDHAGEPSVVLGLPARESSKRA